MLNASSYPEIDILEQPNNSGSSSKYWTQINTPSDHSGGFSDTGVNLSAGYHAYGFLRNNDTIQFTFDGQLIGFPHSTPPSLVGQQMYLLANLAVGDPYSWPGQPIDGATASYKIDYIRAFSSDPNVAAVTMAPISSPDGVDTTPQLGTSQQAALPVTIGAGADSFVFAMPEDAYAGDAQFTVSIDGVQQGGVQTAVAAHAAGQNQSFTVKGNFGTGGHTAAVSFLNDAWGGSVTTDRNLYVGSVSFNGQALTPGGVTLGRNGTANFSLPRPATNLTVGAGADTFLLGVSEDAYAGDAQFTVSVDGVQQGGVLSATASHAAGQSQSIAVKGNFGAGGHTASVKFLNDAWGRLRRRRSEPVRGLGQLQRTGADPRQRRLVQQRLAQLRPARQRFRHPDPGDGGGCLPGRRAGRDQHRRPRAGAGHGDGGELRNAAAGQLHRQLRRRPAHDRRQLPQRCQRRGRRPQPVCQGRDVQRDIPPRGPGQLVLERAGQPEHLMLPGEAGFSPPPRRPAFRRCVRGPA
jgi:hypothetical protein